MEQHRHEMSSLFAQLGQPSDESAIALFIATHRPLPDGVLLHEATFWTASQACFLLEATQDDADWAEVADALNSELHAGH